MRFCSAVLFATSLCAGQTEVFSVPPVDAPELARRGPYTVGVRTLDLVNPGQPDILNFKAETGKAPLYDRPLKVEIWYPAQIPAGAEERTVYESPMPRPVPGVPQSFRIAGKALRDAAPMKGERFPLVVVSHGYPGSRTFLSYLTENLASKGYVVAAVDHTDSIFGDIKAFPSTLLNRANDQLFTLAALSDLAHKPEHFLNGLLDSSRAAVVGYSMGGYGALRTAGAGYSAMSPAMKTVPGGYLAQFKARAPANLKAVVAIAPWGAQPPYSAWDADGLAGIRIPSLFIAGDRDDVSDFARGIRPAFEKAVNSERCLLVYENANHNVGGNPPPPEALGDFTARQFFDEPVWRKDRIAAINQHFITAFLDLYLKGDESRRAYLHPAVAKSNDGAWPVAPGQQTGATFAKGDNTYWKGFQRRWATGLEMHCYAAGQAANSRTADGLNSIRASVLRTDLAFLSSDELEGRLSAQRGSEIAIKWIVSEYEKAGLKPAAPGASFLQPVPLIEYRTNREASGLTITNGAKSQTYHSPDAYGSFPNDATVSAPVVFAGFGITAPELHYDDYAGLDARGKIVLIFDHEPQETDASSIFNGKGNTRYAGSYMKTLNAQEHGAVAVLVVSEPNRKHPSNQERLARIRNSNLRARVASQALEDSEIRIPTYTISDQIASGLLGGEAKQLQQAIDTTLKPQSRPLPGFTAEIKVVNSERRRVVTQNVLGLVEGSDPALAGETIVFGAHYDHDGPAPSGIYHGADDDGSGTVGVVELARAFAKNPVKPRRSVLFAVFAAEERGLLGSYYYVAHPARPLDTTRAMINFDMIGRNEAPSEQTKGLIDIAPDTSNELNLVGANYSPDYKAIIEQADNTVGLKLNYKWDEEPALNVFFRSDHYPFALHGIPSLWWFTGFHPDYHQVTDTAEKINYEKMVKILKLAYVTGFDLGDAQTPPKYQP